MNNNVPNSSNIPSFPFDFDEPKGRLIHERLSRLVGQSSADFYKDACRLMSLSIEPPFITTTNIVAHILREIEGALRDVLAPLAARTVNDSGVEQGEIDLLSNPQCDSKKNIHVDQIKAVLELLGVSEDDQLARAWSSLPGEEKGLQKYAHRPVRPVDEDFQELWLKMETILHGVLDKFEAHYLVVFDSLKYLAQKPDPTKKDVSYFISSVPNNYIAHSRFFECLNNPKWLPLLRSRGFFKNPPGTEYSFEGESKTIRYPLWPATTFLLKMAPMDPSSVRDILLEVAETDNANVKSSLLEIATALPKADRLRLIDQIKKWVQAEHSMYIATSASGLIMKFLDEEEVGTASNISKVLLGLRSYHRDQVDFGNGDRYVPPPEPRSWLDEWRYGQFMLNEFKRLADLDSREAFILSVSLLDDFVTIKNPDHLSGIDNYRDSSYISRPAIENHAQNSVHNDLEDYLIEAVRDVALRIVNNDSSRLEEIVCYLEERKWSVFIRIALWLISELSSPASEIVERLLLNEEYFNSSEVKHEYACLIGKHFGVLAPEGKEIIFNWIESGEKISKKIESKKLPEEEAVRLKEYWQFEKLSFIGGHLENPWKDKRDRFVSKYGELEHPDFVAYTYSSNGLPSVSTAQEILAMDSSKIMDLLRSWDPGKSRPLLGPTKEGLAREISAAIRANPVLFESMEFEGLDPTYVRAYLQTFLDLSQSGRSLNWTSIFRLCKWVIDQPTVILGRTGGAMDQDPDWSWTRQSIISLIKRGLAGNIIPYELRGVVWDIIDPLSYDSNPTPEEDSRRHSQAEDAYSYSINSIRGEAMHAVIEYGLWVRRNLEKTENGEEIAKDILREMPELSTSLEKHLCDPSIAVRAVYGRFIPWLLLLDESWMARQKKVIFPKSKFASLLYRASWSAYVLYVPVYDNVFDFLHDQYTEAVMDLSITAYSDKNLGDPQRKLAEHLIVMYWRGKITLSDPLLVSFFELADDALLGYVMDFIGTNLQNDSDPITRELKDNLCKLWNLRLAVAISDPNKENHKQEMAGFAWWFASGKFEEKWASDEYLKSLEFGSKTRTHHFVADRLVAVSSKLPLETIQILNKIIDLEQPDWMIMGNKEDVTNVLKMVLLSSDELAKKMARELVNRLVARGHGDYADLLKELPNP